MSGLATSNQPEAYTAAAGEGARATEISIVQIAASPYQPRIDPGEARIAELAAAIKDWGFKGHITVRQIEMGRNVCRKK